MTVSAKIGFFTKSRSAEGEVWRYQDRELLLSIEMGVEWGNTRPYFPFFPTEGLKEILIKGTALVSSTAGLVTSFSIQRSFWFPKHAI